MFKVKKEIYQASILALIGIVSLSPPASLAQERTTSLQAVKQAQSLPKLKQQNCINWLVAQASERTIGGRQLVQVVNLQITGNDKEALGGNQMRITSSGTTRSFIVLDPNNKEVRKVIIQRSPDLKKASLRYTSPLGKAEVDKEGLRIVRDTFGGNQVLKKDYLSFQTALYSQIKEQKNKLSSLAQPSRSRSQQPRSTSQSSLPSTPNDLAVRTEPDNDIDCETKPNGKCVCDCTHQWNPVGIAFCFGFTLGCWGDFLELSCEADASECNS